MNFFRTIAAAVASATLTAAPALATVDAGTTELLQTVRNSGIQVVVDDDDACDTHHGLYHFAGMKRKLVLCPGDNVDGFDHIVVRHEVYHAIQHCINVARQTPLNTPVVDDVDELAEYVNAGVPADIVSWIKENYTEDQWLIEFEAQYVSINHTAAEIQQWFRQACLAD